MFDEGEFLPEVFVSPDHLWTLSVEQSAASSRLTGAVWDSSQAKPGQGGQDQPRGNSWRDGGDRILHHHSTLT